MTYSREMRAHTHVQYVCNAYDCHCEDAIKTLTRYNAVWKSACAEYYSRVRHRKFVLRICAEFSEDVYEGTGNTNVRTCLMQASRFGPL